MRRRSGYCTKRRYPTEIDAMLALGRIQRKRNLEDVETYERRHYWCADHKCYHLTSQDDKTRMPTT